MFKALVIMLRFPLMIIAYFLWFIITLVETMLELGLLIIGYPFYVIYNVIGNDKEALKPKKYWGKLWTYKKRADILKTFVEIGKWGLLKDSEK